ncbi:lysostaphin resistance A-like protein [Halobacteriales archaeon Cl-PHB]
MTRWAPFVGLTMLVLTFFLGLARLSQSLVRDDGAPFEPSLASENAPSGERKPGRDEPAETPGKRRASSVSTASVDGTAEDTLTEVSSRSESPAAAPPAESPRPAHRTLGPDESPEFGTAALLVNVALTQGLVGVVLLGGLVFFEIPLSALGVTDAPWVGGLPALGLGVGFGLALWLGNEVAASLADAVGVAYDEALRELLAPDSAGGWLTLLAVVLPTVAFVEELLFRAALVGVIGAGFDVSPWLLAVLSSIAFALGHGAQGRVGVVVTGVLGLVLAVGFVLTGSLLVVVVAHYLVNALEFVVHEGLDVDGLFETNRA